MRAGVREYIASELFSAIPMADDLNTMVARGKCSLSRFRPLSRSYSAFVLQSNEVDAPNFHTTTPVISSGTNVLRLPGLFESLGHSNIILTA
eukprot:838669-Alexandrium_andersonii.AAC.2